MLLFGMAKRQTDIATGIRLNLEVALTAEQSGILAGMMTGEGLNDLQKIRDLAAQLLEKQAAGGIMLEADEIQLIEDSTGIEFNEAADLIPYLSDKSGMEDGFHIVKVRIDPANFPAYEELARTQERSVDALVQEGVEMFQEHEWVYELHPRPRQILMTVADAEQIEELLRAKFATGSDLAKLIRDSLGYTAPAAEDEAPENVFAEVGVEV